MCSSHVIAQAVSGAELPPVAELARSARFSFEGAAFSRAADLTHTLSPEFPVFPSYQPFAARELATIGRDGFAANELCFAEHVGTHIDAPAHFFGGSASVDEFDASRLVAPLAVISIAGRAARGHDALMTPDDVLRWERAHGRVPAGAVVVIDSGWEARLGEPGAFLNADADGVMHHPGMSGEAAEMLVHERGIAGAGVDTVSLDFGASTSYEAHRVVLGAGRYVLESVANLSHVPPAGATIVVGALKHRGGTGGPARLLALF